MHLDQFALITRNLSWFLCCHLPQNGAPSMMVCHDRCLFIVHLHLRSPECNVCQMTYLLDKKVDCSPRFNLDWWHWTWQRHHVVCGRMKLGEGKGMTDDIPVILINLYIFNKRGFISSIKKITWYSLYKLIVLHIVTFSEALISMSLKAMFQGF